MKIYRLIRQQIMALVVRSFGSLFRGSRAQFERRLGMDAKIALPGAVFVAVAVVFASRRRSMA